MAQSKKKFTLETHHRKTISSQLHFYSNLEALHKDQDSTISSPKDFVTVRKNINKGDCSGSMISKGSMKSNYSNKSKYSQSSILKRCNIFSKINVQSQKIDLQKIKQQKEIQLYDMKRTVQNCKVRVKYLKQQKQRMIKRQKCKIRRIRDLLIGNVNNN